MKNKKKSSLEKFIEERDGVKGQIESVTMSLSFTPSEIAVGKELMDARNRFESFVRTYGKGKESLVPESRIGTMNVLKENLQAALQTYNDTNEKRERLRAELKALQERFANLQYLCSDGEVLDLQGHVIRLEQDIVDIDAVIAHHKQVAEDALSAIPKMNDLIQKREDLLAEIETGNKEAEIELEELNNEFEIKSAEQEEAKKQAQKISKNSESVVAGLLRIRSRKEEELRSYKNKILPDAISSYLLGRAEIAGTEFVQLAEKLIEKYEQIMALSHLVTKDGNDLNGFLGRRWQSFQIPAFNLKAFDGKRDSGGSDLMFAYYNHNDKRQDFINSERKKIQAKGINL